MRIIIRGLKEAVNNPEYTATVEEGNVLRIADTASDRNNALVLSDNLTTARVTTIAQFLTQDYGKVTLPYGIVTKMVNNITGFTGVTNMLEPVYGRIAETDIELIVAELLNNIGNVESASGYENDTDSTDDRGMPQHSIEIIVEGGDNLQIAQAILRRKAGGIQTHGSIVVDVPGNYGDSVPVRFNRPEYLYTWLRLVLHGDPGKLPVNYVQLTVQSLLEDGAQMMAGTNLLTQLLTDGIYHAVVGITYIDICTAYSTDSSYVPGDGNYNNANIIVTSRQKVLIDETRIEVVFHADS